MSNPINDIMTTSMNGIKDMVDVNTVIGDAVQTPDGSVIIPVCFWACWVEVNGFKPFPEIISLFVELFDILYSFFYNNNNCICQNRYYNFRNS